MRVEKVWWDYDSSTPGYPPNWRQFEVWPGQILYIDDRNQPTSGDVVRLWYTKAHTLNGLDTATATTIPVEDVDVIVTGAAYLAAQQRAIELAETLNTDRGVIDRLVGWADEQGKAFRYGIRSQPPAWQRYAYSYGQADIDEAIRWAIYRYSEILPAQTIASLTLSADGREVDISSLTNLWNVQRVWWNYDSSAPSYPPEWRDFEQWPGQILFVKDGDEPQTGDVVRLWYTRLQTLNGLDGASTTSIAEQDTNLIVVGAAGFAAEERVQEQPQRSVPRKLREWAEARLHEFERGLKQIARRQAARHSGIAALPALDRWDDGAGWR